jgi:hypothetical protein
MRWFRIYLPYKRSFSYDVGDPRLFANPTYLPQCHIDAGHSKDAKLYRLQGPPNPTYLLHYIVFFYMLILLISVVSRYLVQVHLIELSLSKK